MKTIALAAAVGPLLSVGLVLLPPPAYAGETCNGETATIVGMAGQRLEGTSGRDVVVTNGAHPVFTRAGDDLICVTGRSDEVRAGDGDDTVDASARRGRGKTILGQGSDFFIGGPAFDLVEAGGPEDPPVSDGAWYDPDPDVIHTAAGGARVRSGEDWRVSSGTNDDVIVLGSAGVKGNWVDYAGDMGPDGQLVFGPGPARLLDEDSYSSFDTWLVDNTRRVSEKDGVVTLRWTGHVNQFFLAVDHRQGKPELTFVGTDRAEKLEAGCCGFAGLRVVARMGGGDDRVFASTARTALVYGGRGADHLVGGKGNDRLLGGRGRDHANGQGGQDQCIAETTRRCERR